MRENIKRVYFVHHDPATPDHKIYENELQTRKYYDSQLEYAKKTGMEIHEVEWCFAHEGTVIKV
jgi:hypothetical protein